MSIQIQMRKFQFLGIVGDMDGDIVRTWDGFITAAPSMKTNKYARLLNKYDNLTEESGNIACRSHELDWERRTRRERLLLDRLYADNKRKINRVYRILFGIRLMNPGSKHHLKKMGIKIGKGGNK
jgi:hypothetical protein